MRRTITGFDEVQTDADAGHANTAGSGWGRWGCMLFSHDRHFLVYVVATISRLSLSSVTARFISAGVTVIDIRSVVSVATAMWIQYVYVPDLCQMIVLV